MQNHVNLVGLVKSFSTIYIYVLAKFSFDTAENEPFEVCWYLPTPPPPPPSYVPLCPLLPADLVVEVDVDPCFGGRMKSSDVSSRIRSQIDKATAKTDFETPCYKF